MRGALHWLQREGYVTGSGNGAKSRLIVAPLTKEDARELYSIIGHIEGLGARLTAQLPVARRTRLVRNLKEINEGLAELATARRMDPNRIFDLDLSFHSQIVETSAGPRLLELHKSTQPQAERYWRLYASAILDELNTSVKEHNEIIRAISEGEPDAAERGIQLNWGKRRRAPRAGNRHHRRARQLVELYPDGRAFSFPLLILLTNRLGISLPIRIEKFLAALLPRRFQFGAS